MAIEEITSDLINGKFFWYKELAIVIIILQYIIELVVNLRQFKKLKNNSAIPDFLTKINITEKEFIKGKVYKKDQLSFKLKTDYIKTVLDIFLIIYLYQPYLWNEYSVYILNHFNLSTSSEFNRAMVLTLIEYFILLIIDIPIDYYSTFVIEESHGFNKKTIKLFAYDITVGLLLKIVFTFPILYGFIAVIDWGGEYFFFYIQIFFFFLMIIMMVIYPNLIAPLFNKFTELEEGSLKDGINRLAEQLNFPFTKIFIVDGSKRSSHSNAYFYGFWKNKRIVLYDTLLKHMNEQEILAVVCDEIGHWQMNHFWKNVGFTFAQMFAMFYIFGQFRSNNEIYVSFGYKEKSTFIGISLFSMIYSPVSFFLQLVALRISRKAEYEADRYAHEQGYNCELCSGLIKLNKENSSDMDPDPIYSAFHYTHPILKERLAALDSLRIKMD